MTEESRILSRESAQRLTSIYGLGRLMNEPTYLKKGVINHNFRLDTEKGKFVARHIGYWTRIGAGVNELEHEVLEHLSEKDLPFEVPRYIRNTDGHYTTELNEELFQVYPFIEGSHPNRSRKNHQEAARALATLHLSLQDFPGESPIEDYTGVYEEVEKMRRRNFPENVSDLVIDNLHFFDQTLQRVREYASFALNPSITHGDFNDQNQLFQGDRFVGLLDFDFVANRPIASDLSSAIPPNLGIARAFVSAYRSVRPLQSEDIEAIIPIKLLRAFNGFVYFSTVEQKSEEIRRSTLNYLIRNARKITGLLGKSLAA